MGIDIIDEFRKIFPEFLVEDISGGNKRYDRIWIHNKKPPIMEIWFIKQTAKFDVNVYNSWPEPIKPIPRSGIQVDLADPECFEKIYNFFKES